MELLEKRYKLYGVKRHTHYWIARHIGLSPSGYTMSLLKTLVKQGKLKSEVVLHWGGGEKWEFIYEPKQKSMFADSDEQKPSADNAPINGGKKQ